MECPQYSIRLEARAVTSFPVCHCLDFRRFGLSPFDHTPTSSGHVHLDRQRYDMAYHVTRERALDVAENLE